MAVVLLLFCCCYATRSTFLRFCGRALLTQNRNIPLRLTDAVLVPTADWLRDDFVSERLIEAAKLVESGLGASLWATCPTSYGVSECEIGKALLTQAGFNASMLQAIQTAPLLETAEARLAVDRLHSMGIKSVVVVVPDYEGRRVDRMYRRICAELGIASTTRAVSTPQFSADDWWRTRQSRKVFFNEMIRLVGIF
jgi:hypothetical protein